MLCVTVWTWDVIRVAREAMSRLEDVWMMSARREGQVIARRQVYTTGRDYRHVWGALGDIKWRRWVVRVCAGGLREVIGRWRYIAVRGKYRCTSGAYLGVLMQGWSYMSVRGLICDLPEVPVCLSFTEGAVSSRWLMSLGGSESWSQQMVHGGIYSKIQGDSRQNSAIKTCLMIRNSITWKYTRWNDIWRWAWNV